MKKLGLCVLISFCLLSTACGSFATPQALIKSPSVNKDMVSNVDSKAIALSYLPDGAKLLNNNEIVTGKSVYTIDLDGDNVDEILAFFKIEDSFEKGFIILREKNNKWEKIKEEKVECNSIARVEFTNIINKDKKSLIVGSLISSHAGAEYKVYTLENEKVEELYIGMWNKLEILNTPSDKDNSFKFALYQNTTGNIKKVDIFKYKDKKIKYEEESNSYYKSLIEYYNGLIKEQTNNELAWYLLADAQLKSGMTADAYKSMDMAAQIDPSNKYLSVDSNDFKLLQVEALRNEKKYERSIEILNEVLNDVANAINNLKDSDDWVRYDKKSYLANVYMQYGKVYLDKNNKQNAREYFNKALVIFEELNEKGYYGKGEYIDIHRDADINTAKAYLEKVK